ncbi:hypothetical protein [Geodermatophilus sabuli]|uniref:Uncharacterized protein n=1 Tax=Geodermatophilus sabuli TaxID=1564158 RepID=A0A285EHK1_9ACTN|nr:hypothetical protein [Geodermatophilus sabuli]MBB3086268.1 hypothetical protein [Geodermatophilus sabuli]SNX97516.1 hypothetical protein SAMN06893097_107160 [Geodermatophilus sabuli]
MSSPRDRDGFDDRPDDGSGWREPAHLGDDDAQPAPGSAPGRFPEDGPAGAQPPSDAGASWQPPGWDLPAAEPVRPVPPPAGTGSPAPAEAWDNRTSSDEPWDRPSPEPAPPPAEQPVRGGLFGGRRPRQPGEVERVFAYQGDVVGAQGWAVQHGWAISDGTGPEDAPLAELVASAPVRATKDHRPAGVMRGRYGSTELVAFDVLYASGRYAVPEYAITAAPVLIPVPSLRLSPARFWKHRTGGLVQVPSGDPEFDARWVLLAAEDGPVTRRLVADATVRGLLLGTDDGDEFWTSASQGSSWAGGFVAAIRPDGHRPELIEHHARLLTAIVGALAASS